jgi:hypothetical protein
MESARERRWRLKSPLSFRQPQTPSSVDGTCHWFTLVVTIVCVHEVLALHELTVKLKHRLGRDSVSILENARERTLPSSQRRGGRDTNKMLAASFLRSGRVVRPAKLNMRRTDHYYGFALSRGKRSLRGFLIDRAASPPLRGGEYCSHQNSYCYKVCRQIRSKIRSTKAKDRDFFYEFVLFTY